MPTAIDMQDYETATFLEDVRRYNYDLSYPELKFSRGNIAFDRICKAITKANIPDVSSLQFTRIGFEEIKKLVLELYDLVFSFRYHKEITRFNNDYLQKKVIDLSFDSVLEKEIINDIAYIKAVYISHRVQSIEVAMTMHEYMHALLAKYATFRFNAVISNYHYDELLAILIEYITCLELDKIMSDNMLEQNNMIRLRHHKYNLEQKAIAGKFSIQINDASFNAAKFRQEHILFKYLISDIYATRLLEAYQDDKNKLINFVMEIIAGEKSIKDLIDYYGMSLVDQATNEAIKRKLEKHL